MTSIPIRHSLHYDDIREEIHRRPSSKLTAPAAVCHRSWWIEHPDARSQAGMVEPIGSDPLRAMFDHLKDRLYRFLQHHEPRQEGGVSAHGAGGHHDREYVIYSGVWGGLYQRCILSIHEERVSLTHILDLGSQRWMDSSFRTEIRSRYSMMKDQDRRLADKDRPNLANAIRSLEYLEAFTQEYGRWLTHSGKSSDKKTAKESVVQLADKYHIRDAVNEVYESAWAEIDEKLGLDWGSQKPDIPLALFVDQRGLVLPAVPEFSDDSGALDNSAEASTFGSIDIELQRRCGWPILRASEPSDARPLANRDVVACTMHGGSSIYLSTLGNAPNRMESVRHRHAAIRYVILSGQQNRWANGRLVDVLNRLETYRSLALRGISELRDIGRTIKASGIQLDHIANYITTMSDESLQEGRVKLEGFFRNLQIVVASTPGSLPYRIYRSSTYSDSFQSLLPQLGVGEIQGFQRYDFFVQRQVYGVFEFIRNLGVRLQNLRDRYLVLVELIEMKSLSAMQRERNQIARAGEKIERFATAYYAGYPVLALASGVFALVIGDPKGRLEFAHGVIAVAVFGALYLFFMAGSRFWHIKSRKRSNKDTQPSE